MFKNTAGQKVYVYAYDSTTGLPKTGDGANITCSFAKDYAAPADLLDTSATEEDATKWKGVYSFTPTQAETNYDTIGVGGRSTTANIVVIGVPMVIFTRMPALNGDVTAIKNKTDQMTFTNANQIDANVRDFTPGAGLSGAGTSVDPFVLT